MKKILVATDFSDVALNAVYYAAEIAKHAKAKLILFNVCQLSYFQPEIILTISAEDWEKRVLMSLKTLEEDLKLKFGKSLEIECKCTSGLPVYEINRFADINKVDLIVMGMEERGFLSEKIIGSVTTSVIKSAKHPGMAINEQVKFKNIKKIAFACDYEAIENKNSLEPLKEIAHLFKSHIYVLNVVPELETSPYLSKQVEGYKLNRSFEDIEHSFHQTQNEDLIDGINEFLDDEKIDMVVMIPKIHSLFDNLMQESNTKRMAFHTKVPLLTLQL